MGCDITCDGCNFKTGKPNQPDGTFLCSDCANGFDNSVEIAEKKFEGLL